MYYDPYMYHYPYYANVPMNNYGRQSVYWTYPNEIHMRTDLVLFALPMVMIEFC